MTLHQDQTWANSGLSKTKKWSGKNPDQNENKTRTEILGNIKRGFEQNVKFGLTRPKWSEFEDHFSGSYSIADV